MSGRPLPAPGMTDLMVTPESIDTYLALADLSRRQLEAAFMDAVRAFAQYAEEQNDPSGEAVNGFAMGFIQGALRHA